MQLKQLKRFPIRPSFTSNNNDQHIISVAVRRSVQAKLARREEAGWLWRRLIVVLLASLRLRLVLLGGLVRLRVQAAVLCLLHARVDVVSSVLLLRLGLILRLRLRLVLRLGLIQNLTSVLLPHSRNSEATFNRVLRQSMAVLRLVREVNEIVFYDTVQAIEFGTRNSEFLKYKPSVNKTRIHFDERYLVVTKDKQNPLVAGTTIQHNNDMAHNSVITLANDHSEENKLLFF
ncbi:hypothetical protein MSG28_004706 [Choristoneura fumiferana]|uniref:Uncharacterized protein n=1 Tax=Choristoneura fumiferana TaxID=7141 RepID=A0ACC0K7A9_CHOFU|nr:hypothetical protein MSG28_004706 [Choristoneura fumiferana]